MELTLIEPFASKVGLPTGRHNLIVGALLTRRQPVMLAKDARKPARTRPGAAPVVVMPAAPFIIRDKPSTP